MVTILTLNLEQLLDLIVQDKHERATSASEYVGEGSLEEGGGALLLGDGGPAVQGALVQDVALGASGLHHHAPADGVEGVRDDTGHGGHGLGDGPADHQRGVLGVGQHAARGVVETEVRRTVDDDTLHRHTESSVQAGQTVGLEDLAQAVSETGELALAIALADVGGQAGTREVQRVHEAQRGGSGGTARRQVTGEVAPELGVLVHATEEHLLVLVFEREVEGLGREVPDDVGEVTTPERERALLLGNADEGVDDTFVALVFGDLFAHVLDLQQQLDALDGRHGGLGDGRGDTAGDEVLRERDRIDEVRHFVQLGGLFTLGNRLAAWNLPDHTRNGKSRNTNSRFYSGDIRVIS